MLKSENISSIAQATQIPERFVCVYASSTLPFIAVSNRFIAVWITVFARFDRCLNLFQSITKHWNTGAKLFCILKLFYREFPSRLAPKLTLANSQNASDFLAFVSFKD